MSKPVRKHLPSKDKIKVLKKHFIDKKPISEVCETEKVLPSSFYQWQRDLFEKGAIVFEMGRSGKKATEASERTIAALKAKLVEKNEVIAELMQETIKLKKLSGEI